MARPSLPRAPRLPRLPHVGLVGRLVAALVVVALAAGAYAFWPRHDVVHVTLHSSHETLVTRIENDTDDPAARNWRLDQASRYFEVADRLATLGPRVDTENRSAHEVAAAVLTVRDTQAS